MPAYQSPPFSTELTSWRKAFTSRGHNGSVRSVTFSSDGTKLLTVSYDAIVWNARTGEKICELYENHCINRAFFSHDGTKVIAGCCDGKIVIWDIATGNKLYVSRNRKYAIGQIVFNPDSTVLLIYYSLRRIVALDLLTGKESCVFRHRKDEWWEAVFSPDGTKFVTNIRKTLNIHDAQTGAVLCTLYKYECRIRDIAFNSDGTKLVAGFSDGTAVIWDVATGKKQHTLHKHTDWVESAIFSPDGKKVVTTSMDKRIIVWDANTGRKLHTMRSTYGVCEFNYDGTKLLTNHSYHKRATVWNVLTGKKLQHLNENHDVISVAFNPNNNEIALGLINGNVSIWRAQNK